MGMNSASMVDRNTRCARIAVWNDQREGHLAEQLSNWVDTSPRSNFLRMVVVSADEATRSLECLRQADLIVLLVASDNPSTAVTAVQGFRRAGLRCPILGLGEAEVIQPLVAAGINDFALAPVRAADFLVRVHRCLEQVPDEDRAVNTLLQERGLGGIVGNSAAIRAQAEKVRLYAGSESAVLITGETGTGKEVFARAIHYTGARASGPFVAVNCGALPPDLIENELFGHAAGAYTGAQRLQGGLVEGAEHGTLFFDEVDALPLQAQAKLLRFLQEREYRPLGTSRPRRADVRVISASNSELANAIAAGHFRRDLFFRLNVLRLHLPPLRDRREDISSLAEHLMGRHSAHPYRERRTLSAGALAKLIHYDWPGNVRELENILERALIMSSGNAIEAVSIDLPAPQCPATDGTFQAEKSRLVREFERGYLHRMLNAHNGNITRAAKASGKDRRAFFELLRKHRLSGQL